MGAAADADTADNTAANIAVVEAFWDALDRRDFAAVGSMMSERGHYIDVPLIGGEDGAFGPAEVEARLRLGLEPLSAYHVQPGTVVASGDMVITEHAEEWTWHTGESFLVRFCSVQEVRHGKIDRWWDYLDMSQLLAAAPPWWIEHVMVGYK